jgi:hypothetical protein
MRAIRARFAAPHPIRCIRWHNHDPCRYNPYLQAKGRIDQLKSLGHSTDKVRRARISVWRIECQWEQPAPSLHPVPHDQYSNEECRMLTHNLTAFYQVEYIIMGGTFMSLPEDYRFVVISPPCPRHSRSSFPLHHRHHQCLFCPASKIRGLHPHHVLFNPHPCRDWFIRSLHDTLSGHTSNSVDEAVRVPRWRLLKTKTSPLPHQS